MEPQLELGDRVSSPASPTGCTTLAAATSSCSTRPTDAAASDAILPVRLLEDVLEALGLRRPDETELIKRVVGLPGEVVEARGGRVLIDGRELVEPYLPADLATADFGPVTVPADAVFVLGDNRGDSADSRVIGPVPIDTIVGRAVAAGLATVAVGLVCEGPSLPSMSAEDLEHYEADLELQLYQEYKDVCPMFAFVVETERRFYLANDVRQDVREIGGRAFIELELHDAWVWDMYRASRFVPSVRIVTFKDVNVEELPKTDLLGPASDITGEPG